MPRLTPHMPQKRESGLPAAFFWAAPSCLVLLLTRQIPGFQRCDIHPDGKDALGWKIDRARELP